MKRHPSLILEQGIKTNLKVGHAGTLDPLATGLLIVCTGKKTKTISEFMELEKEYTGTFVLGATTPSFDLEKPVDRTFSIEHITEEKLRDAVLNFIGTTDQQPPAFSAIMVGGKRAYDMARSGQEFQLQLRKVTISHFSITQIRLPDVDFVVRCSKGTYIRSLARDFGTAVGSGAYLKNLRRTAIGEFRVEKAHSPEEWTQQIIEDR